MIRLLRWTCGIFAFLAVFCAAGRPAHAQADPAPSFLDAQDLSDEQVTRAINRAIDFLVRDIDIKLAPVAKAANVDRGKPEVLGGDAGEFMLESYALLYAGQEQRDPRLAFRDPRVQLIEDVATRLDAAKILGRETYTASLQAMTLSQMPQLPEVAAALKRVTARLVAGTTSAGGYGYMLSQENPTPDQSNSQYAVLGVWSAADWGATVPAGYWRATDDYWRRIETASGGWGYGAHMIQVPRSDTPTATMTAAGVATLFVCNEFLDRAPHLDMRVDSALGNGMAAFTDKFDPLSNNFYYLYGVERVGLASGLKFIGKTNWYRTIAANLLRGQRADGSFNSDFGANPARSTCYAIMFLLRGRAPIVMNKLQYDGDWDARPRDSANVHAYLTRIFERRLNWQIVPLDVPVEEWMDAPVLYIAGSQDPGFTDEQVDKLKEFVACGGVIFSVAEGGGTAAGKAFSAAIAGYAARIVPHTFAAGAGDAPSAPGRVLPADDPLFSVIGRPDPLPRLMGISNGVRELWIHSDTDYGALWQARNQNDKGAWELPARIFMYVAGKNGLQSKLQSLSPPDDAPPDALSLHVARLQYAGNWDPEPGAWPRLARLMGAQAKTALTIDALKPTDLPSLGEKPALAHLAGVGPLATTPEDEQALQSYVTGGGTLFVEAIGGDAAFAASARDMLARIFPDAALKTIPDDYLLYTGSFSPGAVPVKEVEYRKSWILAHGAQSKPRLQYMTIGGRVGVIFSQEDITHGLLGLNTWGIGGYVPDSAVALARNIVLFAGINQKK